MPSHLSGSLECWHSWICVVITSCFLSAFAGGLYPIDGVSGQRGQSTLRREAATRADSGTYVCHAENSAGAIRATAFVSVRGR